MQTLLLTLYFTREQLEHRKRIIVLTLLIFAALC